MNLRWSTFILFIGTSCSANGAVRGFESNTIDSGAAFGVLRMDVYPGGTTGLEPQSRETEAGSFQNLELELSRSVQYSGSVTGFRSNPRVSVEIPGESGVPVLARLEARTRSGIGGAKVESNSFGQFQLKLAENEPHQLSIVPIDPPNLPMLVLPFQDLGLDWQGTFDLDFGTPVYGHVLQADGTPLPSNATISVADPINGVQGTPIPIDTDGYYQLRALPGDFVLVVDDEDGTGVIPRIEVDITVPDSLPLKRDITVGTINPARVRGQVLAPNGGAISDAIVRFRSLELSGIPYDTEVVRTTETDGSGVFNRDLAYGRWEVEIIPPYEASGNLSPIRQEITIERASLDMGDIELGVPVDLSATIYGPNGDPSPNVVVTFSEQGFEGWSWTATSDSAGQLSIRVPNGEMQVTMLPGDSSAAITRIGRVDPTDPPRLALRHGTYVDGVVRVEGEAVPYTYLEVRSDDGTLLGSTLTDGGGTFELQVLPPED
jgi:hypothetical protein